MFYIKSKYALLAITAMVTILSTTQADAQTFKLAPKQSQSNNTIIIALNQEAKTEFERGVKLYKEGDLKSAEAAFRKAIDLDSEFAEAYANLAVSFKLWYFPPPKKLPFWYLIKKRL